MPLDDIYKSLSTEEKDELSILDDPVRWAEVTLRNPLRPEESFEWRYYQKEMIAYQPTLKINAKGYKILVDRLKIYRCGRRVGKSVCIAVEVIYHAFTRSNFRVLIIAPYESQIREIFSKIHSLINGTFIQPTRDVQKPFIMEFSNGSSVLGFCAGASPTARSSGIRGFGADLIILDEMDHGIDDIINDVVMPIFVNNRECRMIMSSTPSGRHSLFWDIDNKPQDYGAKIFHIPATMLPGWDSESERLAKKASRTISKYQREYLALFGDLEEGVFLNRHIMACLSDYDYDDLGYDIRNNYYYMGVDWNEIHGVVMSIIEQRRNSKKIKIWRKICVERSDYTQPEAVDEIIKWSEKIKFRSICMDAGFGGAQSQWLKRHGMNTPGSNLNEILKSIDYGGNIIIRDPVTNKEEKKPAKAFLVDNAVYFVENHLLQMPKNEDEKEQLVGAMRSYNVKRFGVRNNQPIYGCDVEDHELNALFLALLAVTMETTDIARARGHERMRQSVKLFLPEGVDRTSVDTNEDSVSSQIVRRLITHALPEYGRGNSLFGKPAKGTRLRLYRNLKKPKRLNI